MSNIDIKNLTRRGNTEIRQLTHLYIDVVEEVLPDWDISLVFVSPAKARAINLQLRKKTYTPNVLSYALGHNNGEIIICIHEAERQALTLGLSLSDYCLYLFIHGLLHLKGWVHGGTMEECEKKLLLQFTTGVAPDLLYETTNSHRHRHRHVPGKNGRGRRTLR